MGCCDIPKVNRLTAVILLIVNIFFPGVGSFIGGIINDGGCDGGMVFAGICQFFLCWLFIPWIWSIYTGVKMLQEAN